MKKVVFFLVILSALSLLDGTPLHNRHGKFIASRTRQSLQDSQPMLETLSTAPAAVAEDDDGESRFICTSNSGAETIMVRRADTPHKFQHFGSMPLQRVVQRFALACDFRI